jgi:methylthioribose-1-phosphate isomerase
MRKGKSLRNISDNGKPTPAEPVVTFSPLITPYNAIEEMQIREAPSVGEEAVFGLRMPVQNHKTFFT